MPKKEAPGIKERDFTMVYKITQVLHMLWLVNTVGKPMYSCNGKLWLPYMTALCLTTCKDKELPLAFCVFGLLDD